MTTKLALKKDTLHELTADDLRSVVAGAEQDIPPLTGEYPTLPLRWCLSTFTTG